MKIWEGVKVGGCEGVKVGGCEGGRVYLRRVYTCTIDIIHMSV